MLYVDGGLAGQIPVPGANTTTVEMDGGAPLNFGDADVFLCARTDESPGRFFSGGLSQLAFWDSALNLAEVRSSNFLMLVMCLPANANRRKPWTLLLRRPQPAGLLGQRPQPRRGAFEQFSAPHVRPCKQTRTFESQGRFFSGSLSQLACWHSALNLAEVHSSGPLVQLMCTQTDGGPTCLLGGAFSRQGLRTRGCTLYSLEPAPSGTPTRQPKGITGVVTKAGMQRCLSRSLSDL